ncbi:MAG: ribosome biogenesis factor YjgA [Acidobacteriota bacterium]
MIEGESRTQAKRRRKGLESLGMRLGTLSDAQLTKLDLPERLHDAIVEARRMKKQARRRQDRFIAGLLADLDDDDLAAVFDFADNLDGQTAEETAHFHGLEAWRERLLGSDGDAAIEELLAAAPQADRSQLRELVRRSRKETAEGKPPATSRKLFRYLRELLEPAGG